MNYGKKLLVSVSALIGTVLWAGCGTGNPPDGVTEVALDNAEGQWHAEGPSPRVEREFWLSIAEEPGWHLNEARSMLTGGDPRGASQELVKVASMLKFEARHSHSQNEANPLLLAVEELREVAGLIRKQPVGEGGTADTRALDRVSARTFRALGAHHLALARKSLEDGDGLMVGRYLQELANDVERGFASASLDSDAVMERDLEDARMVADRLAWDGDGDRSKAQAAIDKLAEDLIGLGEVLGSRRK